MPFSNLELNEWHCKVDNLHLQDYDTEGHMVVSSPAPSTILISPTSSVGTFASRTKSFVRDNKFVASLHGTRRSPGSSPRSPGSVFGDSRVEGEETSLVSFTSLGHRPSAGKPVRYAALELDDDVHITKDPHDEEFLNSLRRARIATPPTNKRRKRAISGAMINASSGNEHYMKARKAISRGDLVKSRLALPVEKTSKTMKLSGLVKQIEEKLSELRYDAELRANFQREIAAREQELKAAKLLQHSEDSVAVNIERVKQGYYSTEVSKMIRLEDTLRNKERHEDSKKKRDEIAAAEKENAVLYFEELRAEEAKRNQQDKLLKERAGVIRDNLIRTKKWIALVSLVKRTDLWARIVTEKSADMKDRKVRSSAAVKIQNAFRNKKMNDMGKNFRAAVTKLREFIKKFVDVWRLRRKNRAADLIRKFLKETDHGLYFIIKSFMAKVLHCQNIWRNYCECSDARVVLLKLKFEQYEKYNFFKKRKELIAGANRRKKIEVELHSDRLILEDKNAAAKKRSHKTVDTFNIRLDQGNDQIKNITSVGGNNMVIMQRGRGGQGAVMKTIDLGLKEDIKKAKEIKVSDEVKTEICLKLLRQKRIEYRQSLKPFWERKREKEMELMRELGTGDARELIREGRSAQCETNVAITTSHLELSDLYAFGIDLDDAFKVLRFTSDKDMWFELVNKGLVQTEKDLWMRRHGLDKHGRAKADSLYVADEDASMETRKKLMMKAKEHLKDTELAVMQIHGMEREEEDEEHELDEDVEEVEEFEDELHDLEEEVDIALCESEIVEAKVMREEARETMLERFRLVPAIALPGGDEWKKARTNKQTLVNKHKKNLMMRKQARRWKKKANSQHGGAAASDHRITLGHLQRINESKNKKDR
ncbi:hypothetical protein TrST_g3557 [Triparma strigata]|uniref:Uncharacterized protein n=1 Tax=Triparma strigata TaxID=1606541 RepID=A0A9W7EGZ1_9STRA|nr:hypothetical protein TrST_g3557 [Triparma strigata]